MKRKLFVLLFVLTLTAPIKVFATNGIGVTPGLQEIEMSQDQPEVSFEVVVSNSTESRVDFRLNTIDFGALDESGGVAFLGKTGQETYAYSLSQWMQVATPEISLEPGATQSVTVTIKNDASLSPGGHYGAVLVTTRDTGQVQHDSVAMLPGASTLVLLKKSGGESYDLKIDQIKANKPFLGLPQSAQLRFQNAGNIHVVPRGTVQLTGPFNSKLANGTINETSAFVLPDTYRQMEVPLRYTSQPWLPGRYTMKIEWRYDGTDQMQTQEIHYWYVGKIGWAVIIIVSLSFVLYLYILYRRRPVTRN